MKKTAWTTIPDILTIRGNDYSRFLVQGGAEKMMSDTWAQVGKKLNAAIHTVGRESHGRTTTTNGNKKNQAA